MTDPTPGNGPAANDPAATDDLTAAARLFGRLLVRELDAATLSELQQSAVQDALAALDIELPDEGQLPALANRYFELFLHPEGALPPVQSLWSDGQYDGNPAVGMRKIAAAANREQASGARSAAPDHIGCILLLWAELHDERPDLATLLREHHVRWAELALQHATKDDGFYGAVVRASTSLIHQLTQTPA